MTDPCGSSDFGRLPPTYTEAIQHQDLVDSGSAHDTVPHPEQSDASPDHLVEALSSCQFDDARRAVINNLEPHLGPSALSADHLEQAVGCCQFDDARVAVVRKLSHHLTPSAITGKLVARLLAMGDSDDARIAISDALSKKEVTDRPSSSATRGTKAAKYETGKTIQPQAGNVQSGNSTVLC